MDKDEWGAQAAKLRDTAEMLRLLAARLPYDFTKRAQLHALADGFERRAARLEKAD
jgi:hypothetical protein